MAKFVTRNMLLPTIAFRLATYVLKTSDNINFGQNGQIYGSIFNYFNSTSCPCFPISPIIVLWERVLINDFKDNYELNLVKGLYVYLFW